MNAESNFIMNQLMPLLYIVEVHDITDHAQHDFDVPTARVGHIAQGTSADQGAIERVGDG